MSRHLKETEGNSPQLLSVTKQTDRQTDNNLIRT